MVMLSGWEGNRRSGVNSQVAFKREMTAVTLHDNYGTPYFTYLVEIR